jgi:hypothetical protein
MRRIRELGRNESNKSEDPVFVPRAASDALSDIVYSR